MRVRPTRRRFLAGALALGGLAGCAPPGARVSQPTIVPAEAASAYPRTIQDKFGPVEIRNKPQRIMAFYGNANLDAVLALGVTPALIATYDGFTLLPWQSAARDVPVLAMAEGRPNIEKVLASGIDLIVAGAYPDATRESNFGSVPEPIADIPIVTIDNGDLEGQLRVIGDALALQQQAATQADAIARLFADWEPPRIPATIKAFGTYGDGNFIMYKSSSSLSLVLERFGMPLLSWPTDIGDQQSDPEAVQAISSEKIPELECDLLLGLGYGTSPLDSIVNSPLFQQLQVVKDGHFEAFSNDESFAIAYSSVLSLATARDLLARALEK